MKKKIKLKGHLKNYMYWPLMLTILLACMNVPMYFVISAVEAWARGSVTGIHFPWDLSHCCGDIL